MSAEGPTGGTLLALCPNGRLKELSWESLDHQDIYLGPGATLIGLLGMGLSEGNTELELRAKGNCVGTI